MILTKEKFKMSNFNFCKLSPGKTLLDDISKFNNLTEQVRKMNVAFI